MYVEYRYIYIIYQYINETSTDLNKNKYTTPQRIWKSSALGKSLESSEVTAWIDRQNLIGDCWRLEIAMEALNERLLMFVNNVDELGLKAFQLLALENNE